MNGGDKCDWADADGDGKQISRSSTCGQVRTSLKLGSSDAIENESIETTSINTHLMIDKWWIRFRQGDTQICVN